MSPQIPTSAVVPVATPVFVDSTGRRLRLVTAAALTLAFMCISFLVAVSLSMTAGQTSPRYAVSHPSQVSSPVSLSLGAR